MYYRVSATSPCL